MTSKRPNSFIAVSTAALISASCPMSAVMGRILASGTFCLIISVALSRAAGLISTRITLAPSCAKRMLDSRPIPLRNKISAKILESDPKDPKDPNDLSTYDPAPVIRAIYTHDNSALWRQQEGRDYLVAKTTSRHVYSSLKNNSLQMCV